MQGFISGQIFFTVWGRVVTGGIKVNETLFKKISNVALDNREVQVALVNQLRFPSALLCSKDHVCHNVQVVSSLCIHLIHFNLEANPLLRGL